MIDPLITNLSRLLGVEPAAAQAVLAVESAGKPFQADGRMTIRFETHIFGSRWGKTNPAEYAAHFKHDVSKPWVGQAWRPDDGAWRPLHLPSSQAEEWAVLEFARKWDDEKALQSISMGAAQIMGFNAARCNYPSARAMFDDFQRCACRQIVGLFAFVASDTGMVTALKSKDWLKFASIYNGPGHPTAYAKHLASVYATVKP